jgi:hypothetical protein
MLVGSATQECGVMKSFSMAGCAARSVAVSSCLCVFEWL